VLVGRLGYVVVIEEGTRGKPPERSGGGVREGMHREKLLIPPGTKGTTGAVDGRPRVSAAGWGLTPG